MVVQNLKLEKGLHNSEEKPTALLRMFGVRPWELTGERDAHMSDVAGQD
jgi:hypothetical protein